MATNNDFDLLQEFTNSDMTPDSSDPLLGLFDFDAAAATTSDSFLDALQGCSTPAAGNTPMQDFGGEQATFLGSPSNTLNPTSDNAHFGGELDALLNMPSDPAFDQFLMQDFGSVETIQAELTAWPTSHFEAIQAESTAEPTAEPTKEDLAANIAMLEAQLTQAQAAAAPKTPSSRKRKSSNPFNSNNASPGRNAFNSNDASPGRPQPNTPHQGEGMVQAMWNSNVASPEARRMIHQNYTSSPAAITPSTPTPTAPAKKRRTTAKKDKDPSAPKQTPTPRKTPAKKPRKNSKKTPEPSKFEWHGGEMFLTEAASREPVRPVAELLDLDFNTLTQVEKATLLLPMLKGIDPVTGLRLDSPGSMAPVEQTPAAQTNGYSDMNNEAFAEERRYIEDVAEPAYQSLGDGFDLLQDFNNGTTEAFPDFNDAFTDETFNFANFVNDPISNNTASGSFQFNDFGIEDEDDTYGARRQQEALEKFEMTGGRRR
jgi:hypothetical protein